MSQSSSKASANIYCVCKTTNSSGFMIECDNCQDWFHGRCVRLTKKAADTFDKWFCDECRKGNHSLEITYKEGREPKSNEEKNILKKSKSPNKKSNPRQSKSTKLLQCANPECVFEARPSTGSKYCSENCGYIFNKLRYETHFVPKWRILEKNHSNARLEKMKALDQLEKDKSDIEQTIKDLKDEKEQLEHNIKMIKEEAKRQYTADNANSKENGDDEVEMDNEDSEEIILGDSSKTFCITCGMSFQSQQTFKHWSTCHKKHEATYNFTADVVFIHTNCVEDENPKLYCHHQDKKTKRYCMNIESACPQHSDWHSDKDEVCACPLNITQKLVPNGPYCLELKKDCTIHYHWDKFRLAQINMQRVHAFTKLDAIIDKFDRATKSLDDTYGGVVGVMLHNTLDHKARTDSHMNDTL